MESSRHLSAPHPAATLCAYAESIVRGRRVAVFGDATLGLGESLVDRGARVVHVYDPDSARAGLAAARTSTLRGVRPLFAPLDGDLGMRDGTFDVVIVPDVSLLADRASIVKRVQRLLPPGGVALFAAPNPEAKRWLLPPLTDADDALGYYELYDLVSLEFAEVRMLGQAPFVGYAIVDFSADEPEVSVDTSILEEPEVPEWYLAVASDREVELDAYSIVELPLSEVARAVSNAEPHTQPRPGHSPASPVVSEHELNEARTRIALLVADNERLAAESREVSTADSARQQLRDAMSMRAAELELELDKVRAELLEAEGRAGEAHLRAERLDNQVTALDDEVRLLRERSARAAKQAEAEKAAEPTPEERKPRREDTDRSLAFVTRARPSSPSGHPVQSHGSTPPPADVNEARDRADARDRALSLLSELATRDSRIAELEDALARASEPPTLRSIQNAQSARIVELEQQAANLEKQLTELQGLAQHAQKTREREMEASRGTVDTARRAVEVQRGELDVMRTKLDAARAEIAALTRELDAARALIPELQRELASGPKEEELVEAHTSEIDTYEGKLKERAEVVERLERDLRESERIGRELVEENEALRRASTPTPPPTSDGSGTPHPRGNGHAGAVSPSSMSSSSASSMGETQILELTERAARAQADLTAASWRIAQLERELVTRPIEPRAASERQRELEEALVAAHRELADARRLLEGAKAIPVEGGIAAHVVSPVAGSSGRGVADLAGAEGTEGRVP